MFGRTSYLRSKLAYTPMRTPYDLGDSRHRIDGSRPVKESNDTSWLLGGYHACSFFFCSGESPNSRDKQELSAKTVLVLLDDVLQACRADSDLIGSIWKRIGLDEHLAPHCTALHCRGAEDVHDIFHPGPTYIKRSWGELSSVHITLPLLRKRQAAKV
jgi:hypothetical protein